MNLHIGSCRDVDSADVLAEPPKGARCGFFLRLIGICSMLMLIVASVIAVPVTPAADGAGGLSDRPHPRSTPPRPAPMPADISLLDIAILGDVTTVQDIAAIRDRLEVIHGHGSDPGARPDAIEVATDVDLGQNLDQFAVIDALIDLARAEGVGLFLRVKPHPHGIFTKVVVRETKIGQTDRYREIDQTSFCDPSYRQAVASYFSSLARHCAPVPTVLGLGVAICPSGETQYPISDTSLGDFCAPALDAYKAWMNTIGHPVSAWPELPPAIGPDTRIARDGEYYLWALWRSQVLAGVLAESAHAIRAESPRLHIGTFSYLAIAAPAGYGPGIVARDKIFTWYFSGISLDHGFYGRRGQDHSRPVAMPGTLNAVEFDLISAYTDPIHITAFARYFALMNGQARPFLPTWWSPGKTGGWAEGFWAPYSDDLARRMCKEVNDSRRLRGAPSVADVAFISPQISGMGAMASWGPWTSEEWKLSHSDITRHLAAIGANFDVISEDGLTAEQLSRYRLVVVTAPALYPWVRRALAESTVNVLVMGWAGMVTAPDQGDPASAHSWFNDIASWWPTKGAVVRRPAQLHFTADGVCGSLAGQTRTWSSGKSPVTYVRGLGGVPLAFDDEGRAVASRAPWGPKRFIYHFGIPLELRESGRIMTDLEFRSLLTNILTETGCTAYGDLGPLRIYENAQWLLVENPNGTAGTVQEPRGDFQGALPMRLRHRPSPDSLMPGGLLRLDVPAGGSILIPLQGPLVPPTPAR